MIPVPSCPCRPFPQLKTSFFEVIAMQWLKPQATSMTIKLFSPTQIVGTSWSLFKSLVPKAPFLLSPHTHKVPLLVKATEN